MLSIGLPSLNYADNYTVPASKCDYQLNDLIHNPSAVVCGLSTDTVQLYQEELSTLFQFGSLYGVDYAVFPQLCIIILCHCDILYKQS